MQIRHSSYFFGVVCMDFWIRFRPKYPDRLKYPVPTKISISDQILRIQPKYPYPTNISGARSDKNIRIQIRTNYPNTTKISVSDQNNWIRPKYQDFNKISGSDQNVYDPTKISGYD